MLQPAGAYYREEEQEAEYSCDDEPDQAEDAQAQELGPALYEDAEHRGAEDEGGYEEAEDEPVGEYVYLGDQVVQPLVPEANLDLAVFELVEERVDLARVVCERVRLGEPACRAGGDVGRVSVARDGHLRRLRCRDYLRPAPEPLGLLQRTRHLRYLDVQLRTPSAKGLEHVVSSLPQRVLAPQRSAQGAQSLAQLAPEGGVVAGDEAPGERQGARDPVHVPAPYRRQDLCHAPQSLGVEDKRLRGVDEPDLTGRAIRGESLRREVGEEDAFCESQPHERIRYFPVPPGVQRHGLGRRLERDATARRVVAVGIRHPQPEVTHLSQAAGGLGGEEHVPPVRCVRREL